MDDSRHPSESEPEPGKAPASSGPSQREIERAALKSLREHVAKAVEEIVRLRAQNKSLIRRLAEFEAASGAQVSVFDEGTDVQELRAKIGSFISSIDKYLAETDEV